MCSLLWYLIQRTLIIFSKVFEKATDIGFPISVLFNWKDNKDSTQPPVASTYAYLRLRKKKTHSVSFMHDLDADVGVSRPRIRAQIVYFTSTQRVKSPHAQKPGREYLSNVQNPLWSSDQHSDWRNAVRSQWWYKTGSKIPANLMQQVNTRKSTGVSLNKWLLTSLRCWPCWKKCLPSQKLVASRKATWETKTYVIKGRQLPCTHL